MGAPCHLPAYAGGWLHDHQDPHPCLLTCIKELNTPRYMSVGGIFECYNKPLEIYNFETLKDDPLIELDTIGLKGSPTNVYKSFSPPQKGAGMMLEGADKATCESWFLCWQRSTSSDRKEKMTMSTFVNTDPTAFKGVWVFCEQREGKCLMPTDFELISEGRKLADDLGRGAVRPAAGR